jgi:hypothetical protein
MLHPQPAAAAQGLQVLLTLPFVSPCDILQHLFLKRQISDQFLQPAVLALKLLQSFGLINTKPTILIAPTIVALLCRSGFLTSQSNRFALGLQYLNLAKLRHDLLRAKSFPGHLLYPFQFDTLISSGSEKAGQVSGSQTLKLLQQELQFDHKRQNWFFEISAFNRRQKPFVQILPIKSNSFPQSIHVALEYFQTSHNILNVFDRL